MMTARTFSLALLGALMVLLLVVAGSGWYIWDRWQRGPDPDTIVSASLQGLREQNVLVPFTARYVAVVTSRQTTLGLAAQKTLIMPGTVRYELDLAALDQDDLAWDAATSTLTITLPALRLAGPEIDMAGIREYRAGELIMFLTDSEQRLDDANRRAAAQELLAQARGPTPLRLARGAAIRAIEQSFAMPLRAANIDATVEARFADR